MSILFAAIRQNEFYVYWKICDYTILHQFYKSIVKENLKYLKNVYTEVILVINYGSELGATKFEMIDFYRSNYEELI